MRNLCVGLGMAPLAFVLITLPSWIGETPSVPESQQVVVECVRDAVPSAAECATTVTQPGR
jgi:hypothetical protein